MSISAAASVLMDMPTLLAHRDLWGTEPTPTTGTPPLLTADEHAVLDFLRAEGNIRMEQERIEWSYALARLVV